MSTSFRILHVSDFHFSEYPERRRFVGLYKRARLGNAQVGISPFLNVPTGFNKAIAEKVAQFAWIERDAIDLVVVSGDIATTGLSEDLEVGHEFLTAPATAGHSTSKFRPTLNNGSLPIFWMPGNHDRFLDDRMAPGSRNFENYFSPPWGSKHPAFGFKFVRKSNETLVFVGVDFCLHRKSDSPFLYMSQGKAYRTIIEELKNITDVLKERQPKVSIIWVMHFPTSDLLGVKYRLLRDKEVRSLAAQLGIKLILAGHLHYAEGETRRGVRLWCAGTATAVDCEFGNWIHILEIDVDAGEIIHASSIDFKWNKSKGNFVRQRSRNLWGKIDIEPQSSIESP